MRRGPEGCPCEEIAAGSYAAALQDTPAHLLEELGELRKLLEALREAA